MRNTRWWVLVLALAAPALCGADPGALDSALQEAQARKAPVLVEFHAPWCYSCYYMARNVLTGPEWQALLKRSVHLELDADSPEGDALKARWQVKAMPSYLVLDPEGKELGRILGEQTRAEFYTRVNGFLSRGASLESLAASVRDGSARSMAAAREVLKSYHARYDAAGGLAWIASLPATARGALHADGEASLWQKRLEFMAAALAHDGTACAARGAEALSGDLGCDRAYELDRFLGCTVGVAERKALLATQRKAMDALLERGAFGAQRCADQRSVVLAAADLYAALEDQRAETVTLDRAIQDTRQQLGGDLTKDRNLADNVRVYLDRAGYADELGAWLQQLIKAYPQDYVYAFRYGKLLLARGHAAEALPFLEDAAGKAYGINRIKVAEQRVLALQALQRETDARRVVAETLKANGPWFPEDAARLKALLKS